MRIYAVADTQIFNFNHSVDVVMMRNVSKDEAFLGLTSSREGQGYFDNASLCIDLYYKLLRCG